MPERPRGPAYAILSGIAVGSVVAILVLVYAHAPAGYQWPPTSQVEGWTVRFTEDGSAVRGDTGLPPDCTTMLVDLDSTVAVTLWVIPSGPVYLPSNGTPPSFPSYLYWSGSVGVTHVNTVIMVTDTENGVALVVFDGNEYPTGVASFGYWFTASDCPEPA